MHHFDPPYAHNDVKPGNILITHRRGQAPRAILMDFGSARPARRQIQSRAEALQLQVLPFFHKSFCTPVLLSDFMSCNLYLVHFSWLMIFADTSF